MRARQTCIFKLAGRACSSGEARIAARRTATWRMAGRPAAPGAQHSLSSWRSGCGQSSGSVRR